MKKTKTNETIKDIINTKIETLEFNLELFNLIRDEVKKLEGKKFTRRYLPNFTNLITEKYGSGILKYGRVYLDDSLSWKSLDLNLNVNTGYSYKY